MDEKLEATSSFWLAGSPSSQKFEGLREDINCDVAIVGAGITGMTAALMLAEEGREVCVFEAREVCSGTTGFTTAKITSLHGLIYDKLTKKYGDQTARVYGQANEWAINFIEQTVKKYAIVCDFTRAPAATYSEDEKDLLTLLNESKAAKESGLPATFQTENFPLPAIKGAVVFGNQALFHPKKYVDGITKVFVEKGGKVFERTRIGDLAEKSGQVFLKSGALKISANYVISATQFPFYDNAFYFAREFPRRSYAILAKLEDKPPQGMYYQSNGSYNSFRFHPSTEENLLIVGGGEHKVGQSRDTSKDLKTVLDFARENFHIKSIDYRWGAQDFFTSDGLPFIGNISPVNKRVFVATGFGGWGMTSGTYGAKIIADLITSKQNSQAEFFKPNRTKMTGAVTTVKENLNAGGHFLKDIFKPREDIAKGLSDGQGDVRKLKGKKVAVYKDETGNVTCHSAVCTHMGCIVAWNKAEKSWDCPCHGSRFDLQGEVINTPAVKPLKKIEM